jgi:hypothetical protein
MANEIKLHPIYSDYGATEDGIVYSYKSGNPKEIKQCNHVRGYTHFRIANGSRKDGKMYLTHRFVWECWNDMIPFEMCIHHMDNDKRNNHLDNLQMVTDEENRRLAIEDGIPQGAASPNYKRTK